MGLLDDWMGGLSWWGDPLPRAGMILLLGLVIAVATDFFVRQVLRRVVGRTRTTLDDRLVGVLHVPAAISVGLLATWYAVVSLQPGAGLRYGARVMLVTAAVLVWGRVFLRVGSILLNYLARNQDRYRVVHPRTLPIFDMALKVLIFLGVGYSLLLAWNVDVTGWLASAGIVGLALGFAAQDTIGNLFAGISILADAPYKIGDFLVLDSGHRGRVTRIGLRSTRILTQDDIEIIVPNSQMASTTIVNESGGPYEKERVRIPVGVAYSSDVDQVRAILHEVATTCDAVVLDDPTVRPIVRFVAFGESSLDFELQVWIRKPEYLARAQDELNTAIFKAFGQAGVEIPFPKRDVYLYPQGRLREP